MWKFCGNAQLLQRFGQFARNSGETVFPENFHTKKLGEITVFYAVVHQCFSDFLKKQKFLENYSSYDVKYTRRVNNFHKDDEKRIDFTEGFDISSLFQMLQNFKDFDDFLLHFSI